MAPLAACTHEIEQAVEQAAHVRRARPTAGFRARDQWRNQLVLLATEHLPGAKIADRKRCGAVESPLDVVR